MQKNTAGQKIGAQMVSATDGSEFTGTVTVFVTLDAGVQATGTVGSGICTHEGHGYHTYAPSQAETNGNLLAFTFAGSGAVSATVQVFTWGFDTTQTTVPISLTENGIADAILKRDWTAVTGEASRSVLNALRFLRNKWSIISGTLTVTKENDTTTAWTGAVTTNPSDPVDSIDPT